jgi:prophage regulatory protein
MSNQAAVLAANSQSHPALTLAEAEVSACMVFLFTAVSTPQHYEGKYLLRNDNSLPCLVSAIVRNQPEGGNAAMRQPDRIIRFDTVRARTGLSRSTIYRKIAEGTFPAQLKISTNGAGWRESDINRWVADPAGWRQRSRNEFDFLDDY